MRCGHRFLGGTGMVWVCVVPEHTEGERVVQHGAWGTVHPMADQHYFRVESKPLG